MSPAKLTVSFTYEGSVDELVARLIDRVPFLHAMSPPDPDPDV